MEGSCDCEAPAEAADDSRPNAGQSSSLPASISRDVHKNNSKEIIVSSSSTLDLSESGLRHLEKIFIVPNLQVSGHFLGRCQQTDPTLTEVKTSALNFYLQAFSLYRRFQNETEGVLIWVSQQREIEIKEPADRNSRSAQGGSQYSPLHVVCLQGNVQGTRNNNKIMQQRQLSKHQWSLTHNLLKVQIILKHLKTVSLAVVYFVITPHSISFVPGNFCRVASQYCLVLVFLEYPQSTVLMGDKTGCFPSNVCQAPESQNFLKPHLISSGFWE